MRNAPENENMNSAKDSIVIDIGFASSHRRRPRFLRFVNWVEWAPYNTIYRTYLNETRQMEEYDVANVLCKSICKLLTERWCFWSNHWSLDIILFPTSRWHSSMMMPKSEFPTAFNTHRFASRSIDDELAKMFNRISIQSDSMNSNGFSHWERERRGHRTPTSIYHIVEWFARIAY